MFPEEISLLFIERLYINGLVLKTIIWYSMCCVHRPFPEKLIWHSPHEKGDNMKTDLPELNPVLNVLPEPVLLLRENRVVYYNSAAGELIGELTKGEFCPQPLASALPIYESDGVAICTFSGMQCAVTSTATAEGTVVTVRVINDSRVRSRQWTSVFTEQMREQMTTLLAAVQQMESEAREKDEDRYDKWLAVLNQSAYRMLRMAGAAELEQALADGEAYHPGTLDLAGLCHGLEMEVAPLTRQLGMTFSYEAGDASLLTTGDSALLRRMLLGLISNAMKAVGRGGNLGLRLMRRNGRAVITVWDDGPGMDERSLGTLFRTVSDGSIPRPGEGMRLGLLNARNIAALHDGVLMVESKQGKGARFTVSLPIRTPEGLRLRTPKPMFDAHSGFSSLLVELSDALPWQVFLPTELE